MSQGEDYYNLTSMDSMSWLDSSEKLKISSEVIYKELRSCIDVFRQDSSDFENEYKTQALIESYYLLIGLSFENLIN